MIKKLTLVVLITCFSFIAKSQFINSVEYKAGVSLSATDWIFKSNPTQTPDNSSFLTEDYTGFTAAFNIKYWNHRLWNLSTQIGYTQTGGSNQIVFTDLTGNALDSIAIHERMDYINFNTLFEIKYPIKKFTPSLKFGPHLDYLTSAFTYDENFNRFNYGLELGGSLNFAISNNLYLSADYNYFWYFNKIEAASIKVTIRKNASVMLGIGYKF